MFNDKSINNLSCSNIIECYGLPGSGKTYFSKIIFQKLNRLGFDVDSRSLSIIKMSYFTRALFKVFLTFISLVYAPKASILFTNWIFKQQITSKSQLIKIWVNGLCVIRLYNSNSAIKLIDQGMIQIYWAIINHLKTQKHDLIDKNTGLKILKSLYGQKNVCIINVNIPNNKHKANIKKRFNGNKTHIYNWEKSIKTQLRSKAKIDDLVQNLIVPKSLIQTINILNQDLSE